MDVIFSCCACMYVMGFTTHPRTHRPLQPCALQNAKSITLVTLRLFITDQTELRQVSGETRSKRLQL